MGISQALWVSVRIRRCVSISGYLWGMMGLYRLGLMRLISMGVSMEVEGSGGLWVPIAVYRSVAIRRGLRGRLGLERYVIICGSSGYTRAFQAWGGGGWWCVAKLLH